jgi:2-amino-4-hydroxy-6-hydroxymethyldihydropteridine diphosphokinase
VVRFWPFRVPRPLARRRDVVAYLGLGSNVGGRLEHIRAALEALDGAEGVTVEAVSSVYETEPVRDVVDAERPDTAPGPYLNAAVRVRTTRAPRELLGLAHAVEDARGRDRGQEGRHGPRPLDIDILVYDDDVIEEPDLVVPHPRLTERAFALVPLAEVMPPGASIPGAGRVARHLTDLAPVEGVELHCRLTEGPGADADPLTRRPPGPPGGPPRLGEPHGGDRMGGVRRGPPPGPGS